MPYANKLVGNDLSDKWKAAHWEDCLAHFRKAGKKYRGEPGSPERDAYNARQKKNRRNRAMRKKRGMPAHHLLALAEARATEARYGITRIGMQERR